MLGGNVAYDRNCVDGISVYGRIAANGSVNAPTLTPHFTVTHTANSGLYNIVMNEPFPVFLGCQITLEGSGVPGTVMNTPEYTWTPATRTLAIQLSTGTTPAGADAPFAFAAKFAEVNVPT